MKKPNTKMLAIRAKEIKKHLDRVKPLYKELDEITDFFIEHKENLTKYGIAIQDNFESANTAWKSTPMRRFELVVIPKEFVPASIETIKKRKTARQTSFFNMKRRE